MAEGRRHRSRPFPAVLLEFGRGGVSTLVRERLVAGKGQAGEAVGPIVRTPGVGELKRILDAAALRHADLSREIADNEATVAEVRAQLRVAQLFVIRLVMADRIRRLVEKGQSALASLARARAEREAGRVEVYFSIDTATTVSYAALTRAFEDLAGYGRIWDAGAVTADGEVGRVPVAFSVGASDIVACREDVLLAPGGGGYALQIFPGFVLLREAADAVVLEHGEIELDVTRARFVEEETLPGDARVVGEAWPTEEPDPNAKEPKTPLPVVEYGELSLKVPDGQLAAYVVSNYTKARLFVEAYERYKRAVAAIVDPDVEPGEIPPRADAAPVEPPLDIRPRAWLAMDWLAIFLLVILLSLPFVLRRPPPPPVASPVAAQPATVKSAEAKGDAAARPQPKPKRSARKAAAPRAKPGEPCGWIRQPNGVLKLVPCPPAAPTPP